MAHKEVVLTAKDVADYLFTKGLFCPFCGSEWMDPGKAEFDANDVVVPIQCCRCRREWKDLYRLFDINP